MIIGRIMREVSRRLYLKYTQTENYTFMKNVAGESAGKKKVKVTGVLAFILTFEDSVNKVCGTGWK
jgi:hypothetical protein